MKTNENCILKDKDAMTLLNPMFTAFLASMIGFVIGPMIQRSIGYHNDGIMEIFYDNDKFSLVTVFIKDLKENLWLGVLDLSAFIALIIWTFWAIKRKKISRGIFFYSALSFILAISNMDFIFGLMGIAGFFISYSLKAMTGGEGVDIVELLKE